MVLKVSDKIYLWSGLLTALVVKLKNPIGRVYNTLMSSSAERGVLSKILNCIRWWGSKNYGVMLLLPLLLGPFCPRVVVAIRAPSIDQINLFENYLY